MTEPVGVLLDANALIALVTPDHVHHVALLSWHAEHDGPFATCPMTQGALVRYLVRAGSRGDEAGRFIESVSASPRHRFWADVLPFDQAVTRGVIGQKQVTDAYLAGLARHRNSRLATLDRGLAALHPDVTDLVPT